MAAGLLSESALGSELTFTHPLYRAAIYADLSPTNRRAQHARAAEFMTGSAGLNHRLAASHGPDEALAHDFEESARTSADHGELGASAWALEQAASLSSATADRERRLLDAAMVQLNAADTSAAARVLASCGAASARHDALTGLLGVFSGLPSAEGRLLAAWRAHDPDSEREIGARAATSLANWMVISGRADQAIEWGGRAVEGTIADSAVWAMARTAQAYGFAAAGRSPEGLAVLDFLPDAGNEVPVAETDALIMRGMLKVYIDDFSGSIADLGVAAARMRAGLPATYPVTCLTHLSDAHFRRGDWDAAVTHAQLAIAMAQDADRPLDLARAHARAAQVLAFRGEWTSAQANVRAARTAAERFPQVLPVANAALAAVSLASARGDLAGVLRATEQVRATGLLDVGGCPGIFNWRAMEAAALADLGRTTRRRRHSKSSMEPCKEQATWATLFMLSRCRGTLASARGRAARAEVEFARAHSMEPHRPMPFEHTLLALDDGRRRLRAAGDRRAAVAQLEMAHHVFSGLDQP